MEFQFAPWERLTSEVVDGDADAKLDVDGEIWLLRRCGRNLWVRRESDEALEYNFFAYVRLFNEKNMAFEELLELEDISHRLRDYDAGFLYRLWQIGERQFVVWSEKAGWQLFEDLEDWLFNYFELSGVTFPFQFLESARAPSSTLFAALQTDWNNADSDLSYAARFAQLSELDRALLGVRTQFGTPGEWAAIIAAMSRACGALWPDEIELARLKFCANGARQRFTCEANPIFGPRENAILGHIMRICQPQQLPDDANFPTALRTLTEGGYSRSFSMEIARPSRHEQLEAALELRAWLQVRWPDGVKQLDKIV